MGLFSRLLRFLRMGRSGAFQGEEALEDLCARLEIHLASVREQLAACVGEEHRLTNSVQTAQQMAAHMLTRARQAMLADDDSLAREAVMRHLQEERQGQRFTAMLEDQRVNVKRLQLLRVQLEDRLVDAEHQLLQFRMRRELAKTRRALTNTLHGDVGLWQRERANEELLTEEYRADAYQELTGSSNPHETLDAQAIEHTLATLRRELNLPAPDSHRELP